MDDSGTSPLRILHVIPTIGNRAAGTTDAVLSLAKEQLALGHSVELATLGEGESGTYVCASGLKIRYFQRSKIPHIRLGRSKAMRSFLYSQVDKYDVVHNHMLWMAPCYYSGLACIDKPVKYICSPHGALTSYGLGRSRIKKTLSLFLGQQKALERVDAFHLTSELELNELPRRYQNVKIIYSQLGITEASFIASKSPIRTILYLSRIHPKKGLDFLIDIFRRIERDYPDWRLHIAGPVEDKNYFEKIARRCEGSSQIELLGPLYGEDKWRAMGQALIFALPTKSENFGLVVGEALSSGTAVICTREAPWQILKTTECGWWVEAEEFESVLRSAMKLSPEVLTSMGDTGRRLIASDYSWAMSARTITEGYSE